MIHYADPSLTVHIGDCRAVMAEMPAESVHCVVTSPPYWGLRDYGVAGQLGLEATPEEYVAAMVDVFREVRRVLRDDGTVWLNLGDSYAGGGNYRGITSEDALTAKQSSNRGARGTSQVLGALGKTWDGMKPKDLVGIPWRVAFALQADGWYLRSDIIWAKPNPMPESVTDRPTKSHEYLFLLSKQPRYYFDADAVREPDVARPQNNYAEGIDPRSVEALERVFTSHGRPDHRRQQYGAGRNLRSVWTIATQPYPGAHFATFPEKLVEPCVKAGTSERGVCPECGAPWKRIVEREPNPSKLYNVGDRLDGGAAKTGNPQTSVGLHRNNGNAEGPPPVTTGWKASCHCCLASHLAEAPCADHYPPVPATILDPFAGSGTVGRVANRLGRRAVLIDLSADYIDQAMVRNAQAGLGLGA